MSSTDVVNWSQGRELDDQPGWRRWLLRPLCCRYALVLVFPLRLETGVEGAHQQPWRWGQGMLADGEFESLGAWPAADADDRLLRHRLWDRGVERIDALLGDESLAHAMGVPVARLPLQQAGMAALLAAGRLHAKILRAVSRDSPFADRDTASACIAQVLQKAEFAELSRSRRHLGDEWPEQASRARPAAEVSISADRGRHFRLIVDAISA